MTKDKLWPAYSIRGAVTEHQYTGLTKRELFAIKALQGMLSHPESLNPDYFDCNGEHYMDVLTGRAYRLADAMLKAGEE
jgi:hypothetical protein